MNAEGTMRGVLRPGQRFSPPQIADKQITALLIKTEPDDIRKLYETAHKIVGAQLKLECCSQLKAGLERLERDEFDVVLLDLDCTETQGMETFLKVQAEAPEMPIVVLLGADADPLAGKLVKEGAQDYLVQGQFDGDLLVRSLCYAFERHQLQAALGSLSLDPMTGLYNRHSFLILADQHMKYAARSRGLLVLYAEIDGIQRYNPPLNQLEEQRMLIRTARVLQKTFRESDVVSRWGRFEFAALAIDAAPENEALLAQRLQRSLAEFNAKADPRFRVNLSVGVSHYDPQNPESFGALLSRADALRRQGKQG